MTLLTFYRMVFLGDKQSQPLFCLIEKEFPNQYPMFCELIQFNCHCSIGKYSKTISLLYSGKVWHENLLIPFASARLHLAFFFFSSSQYQDVKILDLFFVSAFDSFLAWFYFYNQIVCSHIEYI